MSMRVAAMLWLARGRSRTWSRPVRIVRTALQRAHVASPSRLYPRPTLTLNTTALQVKTLPPGSRVGYGGGHVTTTTQRVAVLAAGYAEGVPFELSNCGAVNIRGILAPILGRGLDGSDD